MAYPDPLITHPTQKGLIKNRQAYDFVETYCLGLTYTMTNNLFLPNPKMNTMNSPKKFVMRSNLLLVTIDATRMS